LATERPIVEQSMSGRHSPKIKLIAATGLEPLSRTTKPYRFRGMVLL